MTLQISHRTRGYYFQLQEVVYDEGSYTFQRGTRSWPFSFKLPLEADSEDPRTARLPAKRELDKSGFLKRNDPEGLQSDHFSSSPTWRGSYDGFRGRPDPHRLPSTFEYVSNRFPASCEARVQYELHATLIRPTRGVLFPSKDLESSCDIAMRSRNFLEDFPQSRHSFKGSQIVSIKQNFAASQLASNNGFKTSLLNKAAMSILKPSNLQEVNVTISVCLDRYLRPGSICTFFLRASEEVNSASPAKDKFHSLIRLRSYTLRLIARTALRAKLEALMVQDVNHYAVDGRILLSGKGLELDVPLSEQDDRQTTSPLPDASTAGLDGWLRLSSTRPTYKSDRQFMVPTFKTYNISREYEFAVEMKLECAGVKYDVKLENIAVTMLAEEDQPKNGTGNDSLQDGSSLGARDRSQEGGSKGKQDQRNDIPSTDEKQGPVPPSAEAEPEQLPQYEPGDVPVYNASEPS